MKPSLLVGSQLPEFVQSEHPAFVEFLQAYYSWLESQSLGRLEDTLDIDNTVDGFVDYFRQQLNILDVQYVNPNSKAERVFLKNIKQIYSTRGSNKSFELFFRLAYDKPATVATPWDQVLIPSGATWRRDLSFFAEITSGDAQDLGGRTIFIRNRNIESRTVVRSVSIERGSRIAEIYVDQDFTGSVSFDNTFRTEDGTITGVLLRSTVSARIERSGYGFKIGQVFEIDSYGGAGTIIKVKAVDNIGAIKAVDIISFGLGYNADFTSNIVPPQFEGVDEFVPTFRTQLALGGGGGVNADYPSTDIADAQNEAGIITRYDYTTQVEEEKYFRDNTYVGEIKGEFRTQKTFDPQQLDFVATIKFNIGALCRHAGYYTSNYNLLGDLTYIQDSYYYQKYSYVVNIEEELGNYTELLKRFLHASGTKQFGNYQAVTSCDLNIRLEPAINVVGTGAPLRDNTIVFDARPAKLVTKDTFEDSVGTTDSVFPLLIINVADTIAITDQVQVSVTAGTIFNEVDVDDEAPVTVSTLVKSESLFTTDNKSVFFTQEQHVENLLALDVPSKTPSIAFESTFAVGDREPVDASLIVKPTDFVAVTLTDRIVNMSAVLRDTPFATDSIAINIDTGEAVIDTAFADDRSTRRPIKPFIELVDASDSIRFKATAAKMSMDLARPTDRPAKIPHKYINDTVRAGDIAYGYTQNLYVATDYWQTGYTADDGTIITP
jgi:hypothetical protein